MATITSSQNGLWSATTTWVGGILPATADTVTINHVVTYDLDDRVKIYGRIDINTGGVLIHDNTKPTAIQSNKWLRVAGGKYQAGPGSKTLFSSNNLSTTTEGAGLAGILVEGSIANSQLILEGSIPMPETALTQAVTTGAHVLTVSDASGFSTGEYIAVYHDQKDDVTWTWNSDNFRGDEGFVVHHVVGNEIFIQQRVSIMDITTTAITIGESKVKVSNAKKWQPGMKVFIDDEVFTIASLNESINELIFTTNATVTHIIGAKIVETGAQKPHIVGDHVYKIATVTTANTAANANTIVVANAAMFDIGDRIVIEGNLRYIGRELEAKITAKTGNTLTLDKVNPNTTTAGYIVTKTNRDCIVASTDYDAPTPHDLNRCIVYYAYGASTLVNRKCIMRYVEISRTGNSSSSTYGGINIGTDFSRTDQEREVRGCVIRDGKNTQRNGFYTTGAHYFPFRNNVAVRTKYALYAYDQNGGSWFNNIGIGNNTYGIMYEAQYYMCILQYNIMLNSTYGIYYSGDVNSTFPEWHNIYKHHERAVLLSNGAIGQQYGTTMKNSFEDIYSRHQLVEGIRAIFQDVSITYSSDSTYGNVSSGYADYDTRHMIGAMLTIVNKDFIRGNFELHGAGGIITRDTVTHMGNGWSYQCDPNISTTDIRISQQMYVKYGIPVKVIAYMRKDAAYNGTRLPYIMARGIYQPEIFSYMQNVNNEWVRVELNFTPTRSEMIQIGVGGRGTAGLFWIDPRVSVSTHDLDLIQGPYSVNLMFGLDQVYKDNPSIVLGGITI